MSRYIIAQSEDGGAAWEHFFEEKTAGGQKTSKLREIRFVYDTQDQCMVHADVKIDGRLIPLSGDELEDVRDSLINANEVDKDPEQWGLEVSDELPEWCPAQHQPTL